MTYAVYSFEAKLIQSYILATNKLKDQIGASEQIESLCTEDGLLDKVLEKMNLTPDFSRKAGGAFVAVFTGDMATESAENLQAVWTYSVQQKIPGLHFAHGIGHAETLKDAIDNAFIQQRISNQYQFPDLPMAPPMAEYAPRSGRAAYKETGDEILDLITGEKRKQYKETSYITDKLGDFGLEELVWPTAMPKEGKDETVPEEEQFPLAKSNNVIGIVHADINNLGQILIDASNASYGKGEIASIKKLSDTIDSAITEAVKTAIKHTIAKHLEYRGTMPARPLVLAGDDITFIVRGDLALRFTEYLLEAIETETQDKLKSLNQPNIPKKLTACAGISYIKASQPFYQGYKLSESLCEHAKNKSKSRKRYNQLTHVPSSIAFHRITTSMIEDYKNIINQELTTADGNILMQQPYFVGDNQEKPQLSDFNHLKKHFQIVGTSRTRQLLTLLHQNPTLANKDFKRWCEVMQETHKEALGEIRETLREMTQKTDNNTSSECSIDEVWDGDKQTPVADVIALLHFDTEEKDHVPSTDI